MIYAEELNEDAAKINKIYDPAAGSGSLLLQAKKQFDAHIIEDGFFEQKFIVIKKIERHE